jgi:hypothetical protein
MGRATINSHLGDGLYSADVVADNTGIDAGIAAATTEIAVQTTTIGALDVELAALDSERLTADAGLNAAILSGDQDAIDAAVAEVARVDTETAIATRKRSGAVGRKFAAVKNRQYYESNRIADETRQLWAADLTENLTGDVGLIELGRDGNEPSIIRPASSTGDAAAYDDQRDGTNQSPLSNTGAAAVWNYGVSLGVTKWKPRYRTGIISALENGLADVSLDAYVREGVNMNIETELLDVPVSYLDCDSLAFSLADPVVIEFTDQDWLQPTVIGFVNNPQRCSPRYYVFKGGSYYTVWDIPAGVVASIVDPISTSPIPMPATAAEMANWLADNTVVAPDGPLYVIDPLEGIQLVLISAVEGPPVFCPEEPGDGLTTADVLYEGSSRAGAYDGVRTGTRSIVDPCDSHGYLIDQSYDIEDLGPDNLLSQVDVNAQSNMQPYRYTVAVTANNGAVYDFRSELVGSVGGRSDGAGGVEDWNGALLSTVKTPVGDMPPVETWEFDDYTALVSGEPASAGSERSIDASRPFRDTSYASGAAAQVFVETYRYSAKYAGAPPVLLERRATGAIDNYGGSADDVDPLTQGVNATFTASLQACIDVGVASVGDTFTGAFYR